MSKDYAVVRIFISHDSVCCNVLQSMSLCVSSWNNVVMWAAFIEGTEAVFNILTGLVFVSVTITAVQEAVTTLYMCAAGIEMKAGF